MRIPLVGRHWNISLTHRRLVGLQCAGTDPLDLQVFFAAFNSIYKKLVAEEPIVCDHTGNVIPGIRAPDVAILDVSPRPRTVSELRMAQSRSHRSWPAL